MPHHETDSRTLGRALEILTENGMDGMAKALEIVFNTAMQIERGDFLGAGPFERTDDRIGHANGFKPRRIQTRAGALDLSIPQVRGLEDSQAGFYPTIFEFPEHQRRTLRTTNLLENLNREVRRRTRVATIFPNDASLLRLVSAVLVAVSDGWETDRVYLAMEEER